MKNSRKILVLAPHTDDGEFGAGRRSHDGSMKATKFTTPLFHCVTLECPSSPGVAGSSGLCEDVRGNGLWLLVEEE